MNRISIIQSLIDKNKYTRYLEIGVRDGSCFNAIKCEHKEGVDPDPTSAATFFDTSDNFFKNTIQMFDIIFIDGLHESPQVIKDIANALKHLTDGGTIVMHDCLPTSEFMQLIPMRPDHNEWTGDVWKAYLYYRHISGLEMCVVDCDWGCGIIRRGEQQNRLPKQLMNEVFNKDDLQYKDFVLNKQQWMNVISPEEFKKRYL